MTDFHVVIPSRFNSTRLPGKPLLEIAGKPMVQHVYERAGESDAMSVIIATDDQRIVDVVKDFGGEVCMTSSNHQSGTDRLSEVVEIYGWDDDVIVVNLQGDEPEMPASLINQVAHDLAIYEDAVISTLSVDMTRIEDVLDSNIVKVVLDTQGYAQYFSRAPIPWHRDAFSVSPPDLQDLSLFARHVGLYAYRSGFLKEYVHWDVAPTEAIESLEQLRVLWHGKKIHVSHTDQSPGIGIDTQADLDRVRKAAISA